MSKLIDKIKNSITAEMLFFTAFISRLVIATWDTTMFPQVGIIRKIALLLVLLCASAKIVFYNTHTLSEIIVISICGFCAVMNMIKSGSNVFLILFLLVVAAQGIEFRKILKIYLAIVGSIVGFAFICSISGIIENLRYWQADEMYYRNSFGIVYCTDFAAHIFFLALAYYYLRGKNLKWFEHLITLGITGFVLATSHGKLDSICMVLMVIIFAVGNMITENDIGLNKVLKHYWISIWRCFAPWSMVICTAIMFALTFAYKPEVGWMSELDELITTRLSVGNESFKEFGYSIFGQQLKLNGNGGSTLYVQDYNFTDCSYLYVLVCSGLAILAITLLLYIYGCYKNAEDIHLLYAITVVGINCMIAHHLQDISYNPFIFMIMALVVPQVKEKEEYVSSKIQCYINY